MGVASGLGEATVRRIAASGVKAYILDLQKEKGEKLAEELGDQVRFIQANVADEESVHATLERIESVNILVNCAGSGEAKKLDFSGMPPARTAGAKRRPFQP
ncbi:SDR family NAD(P)-dependent oxidoreductase [Weizmannia acidilactici]|nr:SDR family NAD(P)-dependent oxidoreductase [Weizmannia acidilactici]